MSLLPYSLARPFLFALDAETAHEVTMNSLARLQGTRLRLRDGPAERAADDVVAPEPVVGEHDQAVGLLGVAVPAQGQLRVPKAGRALPLDEPVDAAAENFADADELRGAQLVLAKAIHEQWIAQQEASSLALHDTDER